MKKLNGHSLNIHTIDLNSRQLSTINIDDTYLKAFFLIENSLQMYFYTSGVSHRRLRSNTSFFGYSAFTPNVHETNFYQIFR